MANSTAHKRSALAAAYLPGTYGADTGPGVIFCERRDLNIVHIAGDSADQAFAHAVKTETGCLLPETANTAAASGDCAVLWLAPDRWLVVSARHGEGLLAERFRLSLATGSAAITDVSNGRTVIRMTGAHIRDLLAKGCPVDLHANVFGPGSCAGTSLLAITVLIHAIDDATIDVYVARGLAQSLWEWLSESAAEFGYRVDPLGD
jgi:sarcosine oxidase subunit gamma